MDWRHVKFDWNRARAFLVTAEEGSLSAAARALKLTQPTLGRQVDALEEELGLVLFERVGRGLTLTPSGLELLAHVRAMGEAAGRVSLTAAGQAESISGRVSITASDMHAAHLLPAIIAKIREQTPGIEIEIVATNQTSDLRRREADIAIRNFRPEEPDLIARKIKDVPGRLYASIEYLEKIGNPKTLDGLKHADFINIDSGEGYMKVLNGMGLELTPKNFPITSENLLVMWELTKAGLGIGVTDGNVGDAEPKVARVLDDMEPFWFPIWLVAHREVHTSRRVRFVFDMLARELSGNKGA